jgi:hypothetical protein
VVAIDAGGLRTQINSALIACQACGTGSEGDYAFIVPKHRSGRDLYIEQVCSPGGLATAARTDSIATPLRAARAVHGKSKRAIAEAGWVLL